MAVHSIYLNTIYRPEVFPHTVDKAIEAAKQLKEKYDYDTLAFCGMSGAAIAFILAHELKLPLLCVRKKQDSSHFHRSSPNKVVEGFLDVRKYLLVDDFISSGDTVNYIWRSIDKELPKAKCVAILMYAASDNSSWTFSDDEDQEPVEVVASRPEGIWTQ